MSKTYSLDNNSNQISFTESVPGSVEDKLFLPSSYPRVSHIPIVSAIHESASRDEQSLIFLNQSSFSSSPATAIKKTPHCVSLKKSSLTCRGYKSFEDWNSDPNHVYIGRNMSHHVAGALGSKWGNPFKAKKNKFKKVNKNSLNPSYVT